MNGSNGSAAAAAPGAGPGTSRPVGFAAGLKPYPAMKDSGVPWLGKVPEHWATLPLKRWVSMNQAVLAESTPADYEFRYLDIGSVGTGILTARPQRMRFFAAPSRARRVVRHGDTIVSTVRTYLKAIYFVDHDADELVCSTGFAVLTPRSGTEPKLVSYLCQSAAFTDRVTADAVGIAYPAIAETRLGAFHVAVPPLPEQAAIVRFLDHADRRIRRYIRAKQKLIKLLEEQKQAIIHRAVTCGLDPNVRLKPSGVEWLGDVPEHWEVTRLKNVASHIVDCLHATPTYDEQGQFPAIRTADITPGTVRLSTARRVDSATFKRWTERLEPAVGDVLYSREGERFGIAACVPPGTRLCISQRMMVFRIRQEHESSFVMWALNGPQTYVQAMQDVMGSTAPHVNISTIRNFALALPSLHEQCEIVEYIESATPEIVRATEDAVREIALLREYRTRLIADVVTGKLDVREAAAWLPQEAEDLEPLDEAEVESEAPEADAGDGDGVPEEAEA